ncbi:MAG: histidine--tRNA ligase [Candidatus Lokiarchaeota archaeon]
MTNKKFSTEPVRGMKDFYPSVLRKYQYIISNIEEIAELYCYEEFESPLLEPIEIFEVKSSEELVNEQSFIIEKKEGERLILIPELTPSLARMVSRKSQEFKRPIRWFSIPTCYRYERPQRGRRREFKQLNFDILGEDSLYAELEIINIAIDIFKSFGAKPSQFQLYYNNRRFMDAISEYLFEIPKEKMPLIFKVIDKAEKMEESEYERYLINTLRDEFIIQGIKKITQSKSLEDLIDSFDDFPEEILESRGYKELLKLGQLINDAGISEYCSYSPSIVRGLDYYTGIVFEVFDTGSKNTRSIFGGGRYDDLLSLFSDEKLSGIGFGMGLLMLKLFLETYDLLPEDLEEYDYSDTVYLVSVNEKVSSYALKIANKVRREGFPCILDYRFQGVGNQFSKANELGVYVSCIIGPKEMESNSVTLKNMISEEQKNIKFESIIEEIYKIFDEIEDDF